MRCTETEKEPNKTHNEINFDEFQILLHNSLLGKECSKINKRRKTQDVNKNFYYFVFQSILPDSDSLPTATHFFPETYTILNLVGFFGVKPFVPTNFISRKECPRHTQTLGRSSSPVTSAWEDTACKALAWAWCPMWGSFGVLTVTVVPPENFCPVSRGLKK